MKRLNFVHQKIFTIRRSAFTTGTLVVLLTVCLSVSGQTRKKKTDAKAAEKTAPAQAAAPVEPRPSPLPPKRNERPDAGIQTQDSPKPRAARSAFRYEFTQPDFVIRRVVIEHGEDGVGTIEFQKQGNEEMITDPIKVSAKALERINGALASMNFIDSTESYQYEKDFSHLGNVKFALTRGGQSREVTYNWTENKDAKILMNEYRKLMNQYVWIFDISLSRENQPLEAPKLFDSLDSMIRRNEISDPHQLEPFLKELSNDERIPLIARNHAAKFLKQFEKDRKKEEKQ